MQDNTTHGDSQQHSLSGKIILLVGFVFLVSIALQYPLTSTFPMGGDAAFHVRYPRTLLANPTALPSALKELWYPGAYVLFMPAALVPLAWPMRFVWWMAFGQIATGVALGLLLWRLRGTWAAAAAMAIWGLTPIALTSFFEDATMPQLWSLLWLILAIERFAARSPRGVIIFTILAFLTHPITGLILLLGLALALPPLWGQFRYLSKRQRYLLYAASGIVALMGISALAVLWLRSSIWSIEFTPGQSTYLREIMYGSFRAWLMLAVVGAALIVHRHARQLELLTLLCGLAWVSVLLGANDALGIGLWTKRLTPYLVLMITIGAAYGLATLTSIVVPRPRMRALVWIALFLPLGLQAWQLNRPIYLAYESPTRYLRLHTDELAAITWLGERTADIHVVYASESNRHAEWIPALTPLILKSMSEGKLNQLLKDPKAGPAYFVFFTRREMLPTANELATYQQIVFANAGALIVRSTP